MGFAERQIRVVEFLKSFHLGGTEVQVLELLRHLPRRYELRVGVTCAEGPLLEEVWKLGHLPEAFPLSGSFLRPNSLWQVTRAARWLRQHQVEVVHAQDFYSTLIAAPAAKLAGCRLVVSRLDLAHFHSLGQRAVLAQLTRWADAVVVNASVIERMLIREEHVQPERIRVIRNGLDLSRFDARIKEGISPPLPALGRWPLGIHVANMNHPVKRQEDLLSAVALLKRRGLNVSMLLVGDGPRRSALEGYAQRIGVADRVHFLGHRRDIPGLYARAAFGVLCSDAEGLSNAAMEGMAAGLPMVVTDAGGNTELVQPGVSGWVVPKRKPEALAQALAELLSLPERAKAYGEAARRFVERELSVERLALSHDALYRDLSGQAAREDVPLALHGSGVSFFE